MDCCIIWDWIEALSLTVCWDTAEAKTDSSTFVHAFHSLPFRKRLCSLPSISQEPPFFALGPGAPCQEETLCPLCFFFLPATIRKLTCYSHSPLLKLNETKFGHCPRWWFSFGHQEFSDWLSSSLHITPVKPPLVESTSWKVNPFFLTLP